MSYRGSTKNCKTHTLHCAKYSIFQIPECCTYFNPLLLEKIVLRELYEELKRRGDLIRQKDSLKKSLEESISGLKSICEKCFEQCHKLGRQKDSLYAQYVEGKINAEEYRLQADKIDMQVKELSQRQEEAEKRYEHEVEMNLKDKADMKQIIRFSHLEELTQEAVDIFVRKVTLYRDKRVDIEWNYAE